MSQVTPDYVMKEFSNLREITKKLTRRVEELEKQLTELKEAQQPVQAVSTTKVKEKVAA